MKKFNDMKLWVILSMVVALVAGCGGGEGSSGTTSSLTYTGVASEAVVSEANAADLTLAAMGSMETKDLGDIVGAGSITEETPLEGLSPLDVARLLADISNMFQPAQSLPAGGIVNYTSYGNCGGSVTMNGAESVSGDYRSFDGEAIYRNLCITSPEGNIVVDGSLTIVQQGTPTSFVLDIDTSYLYIAIGDKSVTYAMDYRLTFNDGDATAYFTTATYRAPDGKVYRLEGYRVDVTDTFPVVASFAADKLYHPDYGYVTLSTPVPLVYSDASCPTRPMTGLLRLAGAAGTSVEFTPVDCSQYQICINGAVVCDLHNYQ